MRMNTTKTRITSRMIVIVVLVMQVSLVSMAGERRWNREDVNLRAGNGRRIKAIHFPEGENPRKRTRARRADRDQSLRKRQLTALAETPSPYDSSPANPTASIQTMQVDSPPIEGFVPWIAVTITNERHGYPGYKSLDSRDVHW